MIDIATLRAAGLTDQQIIRVLEAEQNERKAARRNKNRINQQNHRSRNHVSADVADSADAPPQVSPPSSFSPTPPHITTSPSSPSLCSLRSHSDGRDATRPLLSDPFEDFWGAYPKRDGSNPKHPAKKKFIAVVKSGVDAEAIIAGARRYAGDLASKQQVGTPYVKQAVGWLNARMWEDQAHHSTGPPNGAPGWKPGLPTREQLLREFQNGKAVETNTGKPMAPVDAGRAKARAAEPKLVSGRAGNGAVPSVDEVFPDFGLDTDDGAGDEAGDDAS